MRSKFSELIAQGVASFKYTPIAQETPNPDPICRLYNMYWGALTDSHMSMLECDHRVITGRICGDMNAWERILHASNFGMINFREETNYISLSHFFSECNLTPRYDIMNGDKVIYLCDDCEDCICNDIKCCTCEDSKLPVDIRKFENGGSIASLLKETSSLKEAAKRINNSPLFLGSDWHVCDNKLIGWFSGKNYIIETIKK